MSSTELTGDDEGKRVVSSDGDEVGMITEVQGGTAQVDPDPDMFDSIKSKLDWGDSDRDTYPLSGDNVAEVTDDEVRLQ